MFQIFPSNVIGDFEIAFDKILFELEERINLKIKKKNSRKEFNCVEKKELLKFFAKNGLFLFFLSEKISIHWKTIFNKKLNLYLNY